MKIKGALQVIEITLVCVIIIAVLSSNKVPHYGIENIQFSIFTEKTSYNVGEKIEASILITNSNEYVVIYPPILTIQVSSSLNGKSLRGGYLAYLTPGHTTSTMSPHSSYPILEFVNATFTPTEKGDLLITYTIKGNEFTLSVNKTIQIK